MTGTIDEDVSPIDVFNMFFLGTGKGKKYGVKFDVGAEELGSAWSEGITTSLSFPADMAYNGIKGTVFGFLRTVDEEEFTTPVLQAMREKYLGFNQVLDKQKGLRKELADRLGVEVPDDVVIIDYTDSLFEDVEIEERDFKATVNVSRKGMIELKYEGQSLNTMDLRRVNRNRRLIFQDVFSDKIREMQIGNYNWIKVLIGDQGTAVFSAGCDGKNVAELFGEGESDLSKSLNETKFKSKVEREFKEPLEFEDYLKALVDSKIELEKDFTGLTERLNSKVGINLNYDTKVIDSMLGPSFAGEVSVDSNVGRISIKVDENLVEWYDRLAKADAVLNEIHFSKGSHRGKQKLVLEGGHYHINGSSTGLSGVKRLADEFGVDVAGHPILEKVLEEDDRPDNFIVERDKIFYNANSEDFKLTNDDGIILSIKDIELGYSVIKFKYSVTLPEDQVSKYISHEFEGGQCDKMFGGGKDYIVLAKSGLSVSSYNSNGSTRYSFTMAPNESTVGAFLRMAKGLDLLSGETKLGDYQANLGRYT
jgi:hypothetical protein